MKILITVISSLMVGLSMASTNFSPLHELQHFLLNKKRIFISAGVAVIGFLFIFAGLLIGLVEAALQYDAQGFVMWTSLFTVGAGLGLAGLFFFLISRMLLPPTLVVQQSLLADLNKHFNLNEIVEGFLKKINEEPPPAQAAEGPPMPASPPAEKYSGRVRVPEMEMPMTKDVLHH